MLGPTLNVYLLIQAGESKVFVNHIAHLYVTDYRKQCA